MDPVQLQAMVRGEFINQSWNKTTSSIKKKNRYDLAVEAEIEDYLRSHPEELVGDRMMAPTIKAAKIREEVNRAADPGALGECLERAMEVISEDGRYYLEYSSFELLKRQFEKAAQILEREQSIISMEQNIKEYFGLGQASLDAISEIANIKFKDKQYADSVALFALLTTLDPLEPIYWFKMGIAASENEDVEFALRCYHNVLQLNPYIVEAHLCTANCYLKMEKNQEAQLACLKARESAGQNEVGAQWLEILNDLENYFLVLK